MPIETDSEAWKNAEASQRTHNELLSFLLANPDTAYRRRELGDEILDTDWEAAAETRRLEEELSEEEFNRRLHEGELPNENASAFSDAANMSILADALVRLLDMDLVEKRDVDAEAFDLPYDWDTVPTYTVASDLT